MDLTFTKRSAKFDELVIVRPGLPDQRIDCPKQGIIPHDLVHYAVESVLAHRGFLSLVKDGGDASFTAVGGDREEAVERLVETCQAELWGGPVPAAELIATFEHACAARGHPAIAVTADDVEAIRARLADLTRRWEALPINGALTVRF